MNMREFLSNPEWDAPFFKRLAHNDTGQAAGHQGGMVLPKDLREFLPTLDEAAPTRSVPTIDRYLRAEMYVGSDHLADGVVRYQLQTWGGTRTAESRITDGLSHLRRLAVEGDLLVFQRQADALSRFRLILVKQATPDFTEIEKFVSNRRWGPLYVEDRPVSQKLLSNIETEIMNLAQQSFLLTKPQVARVISRQSRIARSSIFRELLRQEYKCLCAVSGIGITTPTMLYEVESAHVVPVSKGGTDDIRNGFTLTQTLHWAFDRGLLGVRPDRTIHLPLRVKRMAENQFLKQFENKAITEAKTKHLRVHADAFAWHFENVVKQWE